jgi:CheY-like chemotaxis protein
MSSAAVSTQKPRLLIIDDEPLVVSMLTRLLRRRYDITTTTSGVEGLRLASDEPWDAILCDVMLPELSGPQLLQRLQAEGRPVAAKVGFMTGARSGARRARSSRASAVTAGWPSPLASPSSRSSSSGSWSARATRRCAQCGHVGMRESWDD